MGGGMLVIADAEAEKPVILAYLTADDFAPGEVLTERHVKAVEQAMMQAAFTTLEALGYEANEEN